VDVVKIVEEGDNVVIIPTSSGDVAINPGKIEEGSNVIILPTSSGNVAINPGTVSEGDNVVVVPTQNGNVAIKGGMLCGNGGLIELTTDCSNYNPFWEGYAPITSFSMTYTRISGYLRVYLQDYESGVYSSIYDAHNDINGSFSTSYGSSFALHIFISGEDPPESLTPDELESYIGTEHGYCAYYNLNISTS
jgi:hypothetical protein